MKRSLILILAALAPGLQAGTLGWTLTNHAGDYTNELVRLKMPLATPYDATRLVVTEDGREVQVQVEIHQGIPTAVLQGDLWVCTTIAAKASHDFQVNTDGQPQKHAPLVKVTKDGSDWVLDNGLVAVKVPAEFKPSPIPAAKPPGPITAFRAAGGPWIGASAWRATLPVAAFSTMVVGDGTLFGKVRLRYEFSSNNTGTMPPLTPARHGTSSGSGHPPPNHSRKSPLPSRRGSR